jgi:hypothetical protein
MSTSRTVNAVLLAVLTFAAAFLLGISRYAIAHSGCDFSAGSPDVYDGDPHDQDCEGNGNYDSFFGYAGGDHFAGHGGTDHFRGATGWDVFTDGGQGGDTDKACDGDGDDEARFGDGDNNDFFWNVTGDGFIDDYTKDSGDDEGFYDPSPGCPLID